MKKTLIASAIAAAALSTSAFAMDQATDIAERLDSMPTVYGNIQLVHKSVDTDAATSHELEDNGSTIGIKHKHAITEDLEGFMKAELEFAADSKDTADNDGKDLKSKGLSKLDEAYIGVKGDFGSIQVGSDDTVYEWVMPMDTSEATGLVGGIAGLKEGDNLQYESPVIMDALTLGVTAPVDSDSVFGGALAAKYARDNFTVAFAYALGREDGVDENNVATAAGDTWGLAGSIALDDLTLIAQYETKDESTSGANDGGDFMGLQGKYVMGANKFKLGYGIFSGDDDTDLTGIEFQALHNLSSNMYVYLEYFTTTEEATGAPDVDEDTLAIGATYAF